MNWLRKLLQRRLYLRIVFKSGHVETVRVTRYEVTHNLSRLTWTDPPEPYRPRALSGLRMDHVSAVLSEWRFF